MKKCVNCGHGVIDIDGTLHHSGVNEKGIQYNQKLCWMIDCDCVVPKLRS